MGLDLLPVDRALVLVGKKDLDDIGLRSRFSDSHDLHAILDSRIPAFARAQANHNIEPAVTQVQ